MKVVLFFVLISIQYNGIIQTYLVFLCHQLLSTWSNEVATLSQVVRCNENHCHWLVVVRIQYVEWHLSFAQSLSSMTVKKKYIHLIKIKSTFTVHWFVQSRTDKLKLTGWGSRTKRMVKIAGSVSVSVEIPTHTMHIP
jgi:hypothetical protein